MYFFEKVPKPLSSTFSSNATASTIDSMIESIVNLICIFVKSGNWLKSSVSISDRLKVLVLLLLA